MIIGPRHVPHVPATDHGLARKKSGTNAPLTPPSRGEGETTPVRRRIVVVGSKWARRGHCLRKNLAHVSFQS